MTTDPAAVQAARLRAADLTTNYVCTACHGPLVLRWVLVADVIVCAAGCRPSGYVRRDALARQRHAALTALDNAKLGQAQPAVGRDGRGEAALGWTDTE